MIELQNVNKSYPLGSGKRKVLDDVSFLLKKGEKLGILGHNGSGKSTLIRIISGAEKPSTGTVNKRMSVSWPLAFSGAFQGSLTGYDNLRFISRIYNTDFKKAKLFVEEFSELGQYLKEPVKIYSAGMRARLAFGMSLAIDFDCYLIDEIVAVGDQDFQKKCHYELFEKRQDKAMILVSHDPNLIRSYCTHAAILENGKFRNYSNLQTAYDAYHNGR